MTIKNYALSTAEFTDYPFQTLFFSSLPASLPLAGKAAYLKEFSVALSRLDSQAERALARDYWGNIISGFSAAITISGAGSLVPIAGWSLSAIAVASAVASIGKAVHVKSKATPILETLKNHRLALDSQESIQWAALWELVGVDLFCQSLSYASRPSEFKRSDSPFMKAVDFIAECQGVGYEQVITQAKAIKASHSPAVGQTTKLIARDIPPGVPVEEKPDYSLKAVPTIKPSSPVRDAPQPSQATLDLTPEKWTPDLMSYPSILIYGAQGAGKTSTAAWLIRERIKAGHQIKVLDPHRAYGQWKGLECIGDGMDFYAINLELVAFTDEIKERYKTRSMVENYNPPKLTLVCDEFTSWSTKCPHAPTFFGESLTDIRKVNLHVLFISHARTMTGLGGSVGLAATRDAGLLELELEAQVDPTTKKASPKLSGWLKYPGVENHNRQKVKVASWMNGDTNFSDIIAVETQPTEGEATDKLEALFNAPAAKEPQIEGEDLTTEEGRIQFVVDAVEEFLDSLSDSTVVWYTTVRELCTRKNRLKRKIGNTDAVIELIKKAAALGKLRYSEGAKGRIVGYFDSPDFPE